MSTANKMVPVDPTEYDYPNDRFVGKSYHDPQIWMSYDVAATHRDTKPQIDGVGFVPIGQEISYIDFDNCLHPEKGEVESEVFHTVARLKSYTEISYSGTGLHVLCRGNSPTYGTPSDDFEQEISVFDGSWVAITENHVQGFPKTVLGSGSDLKRICEEYEISAEGLWTG